MQRKWKLSAVAMLLQLSIACLQATAQDVEELKAEHIKRMSNVNPIMQAKVFPTLSDPEATVPEPFEDGELAVFVSALQLASEIQEELSDSPVDYKEEVQRAAKPEWVRKRVCHRVCYRDRRGCVRTMCCCRYEWVRVDEQQEDTYKLLRQPLREAIDDVLAYFEDRLRGETGDDAVADRTAALQAHSIMLIVDPEFQPGDIVNE